MLGRRDDVRRQQRTVPEPEQSGSEKPGLPGDSAPRLFVIGDATGLKAFDQGCRLSQTDAYSLACQSVDVTGCVPDKQNIGVDPAPDILP